MKFVFLALATAPLLLPLIFHSDKKIFNHGNFKAAVSASLIAALLFSALTAILAQMEVVTYQVEHTLGLFFQQLPLEHYLLNFTFSFAIIGLYQYLNVKFPKNTLQQYSLALSNLLLGLCVAFLFFGYTKPYTLLTFALLFSVLFLIEYVGKLRFMYRAYRTFVVMLVPFYMVYAVLFSAKAIVVHSNQAVGIASLGIPLEAHFVLLSTVLLTVYMFEFFKAKN